MPAYCKQIVKNISNFSPLPGYGVIIVSGYREELFYGTYKGITDIILAT